MPASVWRTVDAVGRRAGPGFVAATLGVALAVATYALLLAPVVYRRYLHMVLGLVWIGTNLVLGLVLGPALDRMDAPAQVEFHAHALPRLAVLLPVLLLTTIGVGLPLAVQMGLFPHAASWLALTAAVVLPGILLAFAWRFDAWTDGRWRAAFGATTLATLAAVAYTIDDFAATTTGMWLTLLVGALITLTAFGLDLSGTLRALHELRRDDPDTALVAQYGRQTFFYARVQLLLQVFIVISVLD